jgi:hypothetical protein
VVSVLVSFIAVRDRASTREKLARAAAKSPATHRERRYAELTSERSQVRPLLRPLDQCGLWRSGTFGWVDREHNATSVVFRRA